MDGLRSNYNLKGWKVELKPGKKGNKMSDKVILGILSSNRNVLPSCLLPEDPCSTTEDLGLPVAQYPPKLYF